MTGRITSTDPARAPNGRLWSDLYESERRVNARLIVAMRAALEVWMQADEEGPNSRKRRLLMEKARHLTMRALN